MIIHISPANQPIIIISHNHNIPSSTHTYYATEGDELWPHGHTYRAQLLYGLGRPEEVGLT